MAAMTGHLNPISKIRRQVLGNELAICRIHAVVPTRERVLDTRRLGDDVSAPQQTLNNNVPYAPPQAPLHGCCDVRHFEWLACRKCRAAERNKVRARKSAFVPIDSRSQILPTPSLSNNLRGYCGPCARPRPRRRVSNRILDMIPLSKVVN